MGRLKEWGYIFLLGAFVILGSRFLDAIFERMLITERTLLWLILFAIVGVGMVAIRQLNLIGQALDDIRLHNTSN